MSTTLTPSMLCFWHRSGKPAWVNEPFKGPNCWLCKDKPDAFPSPTEIIAASKKKGYRVIRGLYAKAKKKEIVIK